MALEDIDARFQFDTDCYFYIYYEGDTLFYGRNFKEGDLLTMLKHFYDEEITAHPDLIEFANEILKSTGS